MRETAPPHSDANALAYLGGEPSIDQRSRPFEVVEQHRKATSIDLPRAQERSAVNAPQARAADPTPTPRDESGE